MLSGSVVAVMSSKQPWHQIYHSLIVTASSKASVDAIVDTDIDKEGKEVHIPIMQEANLNSIDKCLEHLSPLLLQKLSISSFVSQGLCVIFVLPLHKSLWDVWTEDRGRWKAQQNFCLRVKILFIPDFKTHFLRKLRDALLI